MKSFSHLTKFVAAIVLSLGLTTTAAIADNIPANNATNQPYPLPTKKNAQFLFTQTAPSASIVPLQEKGWYTLTLNNVNPDVLWFSDRPNRLSGDLTMTDFIKYWKDPSDKKNFVKDHPNADMIGVSGDTKVRGVFMLSKPVYDPQQKTLTYRIYHIAGAGNFTDKITSLQHVAVFIDSNCFLWC